MFLILGGPFGLIDHEEIDWGFLWLEFQAELLFQRRKDRGSRVRWVGLSVRRRPVQREIVIPSNTSLIEHRPIGGLAHAIRAEEKAGEFLHRFVANLDAAWRQPKAANSRLGWFE